MFYHTPETQGGRLLRSEADPRDPRLIQVLEATLGTNNDASKRSCSPIGNIERGRPLTMVSRKKKRWGLVK